MIGLCFESDTYEAVQSWMSHASGTEFNCRYVSYISNVDDSRHIHGPEVAQAFTSHDNLKWTLRPCIIRVETPG